MQLIPEFDSSTMDGFIVADPEQARYKIEHIRQLGARMLGYDFDCCRTILVKSLWELTREGLSEHKRMAHEKLSKQNVPLVESGELTPEVAYKWQDQALGLLRGARVARLKHFTSQAKAREATAIGLDILGARGVTRRMRTATYDIGVRSALRANRLNVDIIDATVMHTFMGWVTGYDPKTLTNDLNKGEGHLRSKALAASIAERPASIIVGDRMQDTLISDDPEAYRIRVGGDIDFNDKKAVSVFLHESFNRDNDPRYRNPFDAVIIGSSLLALAGFNNWITTPTDQLVPRLWIPEQSRKNRLFVIGADNLQRPV